MKILFNILIAITIAACSGKTESRRYNYRIAGDGEPSVVISMAMGETVDSWTKLQHELSQITRVVNYDRLGLGGSDTITSPRTVKNLSDELHEFLTMAKIPKPYLMIGHSLGTCIIRRYQNDYPEDVVGMILIDPVHEDQFDRLMAVKTPEGREETLSDREHFLSTLKPGELNEAVQYHEHRKAMKELPYPTNIPITILGSFQVGHGATEEDRQIKKQLFDQWVTHAPQIKLIVTTKSGHYIQDSEPELVIKEVKLMVERLKPY
jgi:pimeloyl-ACP methyl ester carboxylesterase